MVFKNYFKNPQLISSYILTNNISSTIIVNINFSFFVLYNQKIRFFCKTLTIKKDPRNEFNVITIFSFLRKTRIEINNLPIHQQTHLRTQTSFIKKEDFKIKNNQIKKIDPNLIEEYDKDNLHKLRLNIESIPSIKFNKQNFINLKITNTTFNESK